jgi:hypothetical protein
VTDSERYATALPAWATPLPPGTSAVILTRIELPTTALSITVAILPPAEDALRIGRLVVSGGQSILLKRFAPIRPIPQGTPISPSQ